MNYKIAVLLVMLMASVTGCKSSENEESSPQNETQTVVSTPSPPAVPVESVESVEPASPLLGSYVGYFVAVKMDESKSPMYRNKINVSIDLLKNGQISGHSVVAGNNRPFAGTYTETAPGVVKAQVKEPGDDPYDGAFAFTLKGDQLNGIWDANNKKLSVTRRSYDLSKTSFAYNPQQVFGSESNELYNSFNQDKGTAEYITEDASKFNASTTLLTAKDVENMYKRDLEVIRNTIYARHGYSFQNREMRDFFDNLSWYIPVSIDVTQDLTEIEIKNIALLKRYEQHATAYYDSFGR